MAMEDHAEEWWVPDPHQAPWPRVPLLWKKVPITFGCENQQILWPNEMRVAVVPGTPFKGTAMDLLIDRLALSELQLWGSTSKGTRNIYTGRNRVV